jgi:deoxyribodipyrimidine photo-lyase
MTAGRQLPVPEVGDEVGWVRTHLGHLTLEAPKDIAASPRWRGTQGAADAAVAALDLRGYSRRRNEVWPPEARGATGLSPWIRHGVLTLGDLWQVAGSAPTADAEKFRDELAWQEYARHLWARLGQVMTRPLRALPIASAEGDTTWDRTMVCVDTSLHELERDGWMVNQTRLWLASHWSVRHGAPWREGEDEFFRHLLDGSRAANRLGWQWTIGSGTGRPYGFSRQQVQRRAPEFCQRCPHRLNCPIERWPDTDEVTRVEPPDVLRRDPDPDATAGPRRAELHRTPEAVWLTAESLGDSDPALAAHPDLAVVFIFDEPLLARLQLSGKRLVFLAERLAELAQTRQVEVQLARPHEVVSGRALAVTFAPVPGFRRLAKQVPLAQVHPWPWLRRPTAGSLSSFSAWWGRDRRLPSQS